MNKWLLVICLLCFSVSLFAQTPKKMDGPYASEWKKADSFLANGLPQSAREQVNKIYEAARQKDEKVQALKAQLYLLRIAQSYENSDSINIAYAEKQAAESSFSEKNIWNSIAAALYWSYYQDNRWQILRRTTVSGATGNDFALWDAAQFYKKISSLYMASLKDADQLKQTDISNFDPVLQKGVHTASLRPTLYDLLVFRALEYFQNDEKELAQPAYKFVLNDPQLFAPAAEFANYTPTTKDSTSLHFYALKLYRRILSFHLNDVKAEALIDADLQRLEFVYNNSVLRNKKQLYQNALEQLAQKYAGNPASAEAAFRATAISYNDNSNNYNQEATASDDEKADLPAIKKKFEKIVQQYPESEGGIHALALIHELENKSLQLVAEDVVLPDEPSRISLAYRNVPVIYLRLIQLDQRNLEMSGSDELAGIVSTSKPLRSWSVVLPGTADLRSHRTEIKIDALPRGVYTVVASMREDFRQTDNLVSYVIFQSSQLSVVMSNNNNNDIPSGYVLNRKTGAPVYNAQLFLYLNQYNSKTQSYNNHKATTATTGKDGSFRFNNSGTNYSKMEVMGDRDELVINSYLSFYRNPSENRSETKTFFFTDRSIYRPGQTIYYKGIIVQSDSGGRKNKVVAGKETEITFYDVNGQKIRSAQLKTNEYGSFNGSFTAPETGLSGQFRITNGSGDKYMQIAEYKRPKFEVAFDTLKSSYALNETVVIKGFAKAYAGNNIDGATVKYRVTRQARWPYYWMYYRGGASRSAQQEITNGIVKTRADGSFTIPFTAIPDESVDEKTLPIFTYTVYTDVTDVNGETHNGAASVSAGYRSIQVQAGIPGQAAPAELDTLNVQTQNLNGNFVAATVKMTIATLRQPQQVIRKRLWAKPDQFVMDEASFRKDFPMDEYREESDHLSWEKDAAVYTTTFTTTEKGDVPVPQKTWNRNGWYVIELETADNKGRKVTEKKYVQVWGKGNTGKITDPLLVINGNEDILPGDKPGVTIVSGYDAMHLVQGETTPTGQKTAVVKTASGLLTWDRTVTENDRGGIALSWVMVKENRVYQGAVTLPVAWTNKDLHISWETHRDKLQPGQKETWTMVIKGDKKDKVAAEMAATLYDASLDALYPHDWSVYGLYPAVSGAITWNEHMGFGTKYGNELAYLGGTEEKVYEKRYDLLLITAQDYATYGWGEADSTAVMDPVTGADKYVVTRRDRALPNVRMAAAPAAMAGNANGLAYKLAEKDESSPRHMILPEPAEPKVPPVALRKNLSELAFFYPALQTDAEGNVRIAFTMPEALTEWKLMGFAHTKDMRFGMLEGKVKTQKDLMVTPGLPRFLRQGDDMVITTKISNLSDHELKGMAGLQFADAQTGMPLNLPFRLQKAETNFTVAAGQSTVASWRVHVPESRYEPVAVRITARAGDFTDGEENTLPVVSNRMLVTETQPLWINGSGTKNFKLSNLVNAASSSTVSNYNLSVEYTANPAWYAVQALPYLTEYPYECAEQTFNRYYANALAAHIAAQAPKLKAVFDKWENEDTAALLSNLQKNQELKTALLEETPWVMEAKDETEQKHRIALLFNASRMSRQQTAAMNKLEDMLVAEGGFPWFKGMSPDRYITQYIATGIGRLQHLGVAADKGRTKQLLDKALPYLGRKLKDDYDELMKQKDKGAGQHMGYTEIQYLYMRSFFPDRVSTDPSLVAETYYKKQAAKYWPSFNAYMKGMIAIVLYRTGDKQTAHNIIQSLKETAVHKEETGMYWLEQGRSYWWYEAPVEAQSLLIECFAEVAKDTASVNEMKLWLLKQKQTQNWPTTKATADACYALLLSGSQWLTTEPVVTIQLGNETIKSTEQKQQAGTGYFKVNYTGENIQPAMGNITVTTANTNMASWGAAYWQYFEDMDKIGSAATGLTIKKQLFVEKNSDQGPVLEAVTETNPLKVGDKVKVRIELTSDRDMEYVQLKDMRGACFEPLNVLSGYKWQDGLGYYESTKDLSSNFFISWLAKGKYVFEYPVYVTHTGTYSNGIATIQCMYAPEFSAHSAGMKVNVK